MNGEEAGPAQTGKKPVGKILLIVVAIIIIGAAAYLILYGPDILPPPKPIQMLIIGQPSVDLIIDLDAQKDLVYYQERNAADLGITPGDKLKGYDVVLLDQHLGMTQADKGLSRQLGEALENYVRTGGKLVVIMDSGVYRVNEEGGVAVDVIGWKASLGEIMPVECDLGRNDVPTCTQLVMLSGKIHRQDSDHAIMQGIEVAPSQPAYGPLTIATFDVKPTGNEIAFIKSAASPSHYPGILEKDPIIGGKVLYFNYDPAMTPGIWQNTLEYLR